MVCTGLYVFLKLFVLIFYNLKKNKDQCKPWDPIGIANEYTLINTISL